MRTEDSDRQDGRWKRIVGPFALVALGIAAVLLSPLIKRPPQRQDFEERAVTVRVITVPEVTVTARATGYGTVEPGQVWQAVAEVSGQIAWRSPDLRNGRIVESGRELLRIDARSYEFAVAQISAELEATDAKQALTLATLKIRQRDHALLETELGRQRVLEAEGTVSTSSREVAERQLLNSETVIQNLESSLEVVAAERRVLAVRKASAELDLARTVFVAPFDVRIVGVEVENQQFASIGQSLFSGDWMAVAEIEAQFPIGRLRPLVGGSSQRATSHEDAVSWAPGVHGLDALVRLRSGDHQVEWSARVDRVGGEIDPATQSLGIVVAVDDPYGQAVPGERPPLVRNLFVEVELIGRALAGQTVIPLSALHEGKVYVADEANRLAVRPVVLNFRHGGFASVAEGLRPGERVVVSDPIPAVAGMLLAIVHDEKAEQRLIGLASGKKGRP